MSGPWGHSDVENPERWSGGFDTREEAIADGRKNYEGQTFWIMEGTPCDGTQFLPSIDHILDCMNDSACDAVGEVAEEWPQMCVTAEAEEELRELLKAWVFKYASPAFWAADGMPEKIGPEEANAVP